MIWILAWIHESWIMLVEMSPWLILGFVVSGLLHSFLPQGWIKRHLSGDGWRGAVRAALVGTPLPLCSCGVIPVAQYLRKEGASKSATMSFLVSTPMTGVDSILATHAMLGPWFAGARALTALISGVIMGSIVPAENVVGKSKVMESELPTNLRVHAKSFWGRVWEGIAYGFGDLLSDVSRWLLLGIVLGGAIAAFVPDGFLEGWGRVGVWGAYFSMMLLGIPLYVCAMGSIPIAAALVAKGVSPGAALLFLIVGPATNVATLAFVRMNFGSKMFVRYLLVLAGVGLTVAVLFDAFGGKLPTLSGHEHGHESVDYLGIASAVLMVLLISQERFNAMRAWFIAKNGVKKMSENDSVEWKIEAMNCNNCARHVENVARSQGVEGVNIDVSARIARFSGVKDLKLLQDALKEKGYPPAGVDD